MEPRSSSTIFARKSADPDPSQTFSTIPIIHRGNPVQLRCSSAPFPDGRWRKDGINQESLINDHAKMMTQVLAALVGKFSDDNNLSKAVWGIQV